jgi:DNA primase
MEFSEILNKLDFTELVSSKVKLFKAGKNKFRGLSPFTSEKTPSFYVDSEAKTWYCFSSGFGGGVLDYISKIENVDKTEALIFLKNYLGIEEEENQDTKSSKLKKALSYAHNYFMAKKSLAEDYLMSRGYTKEYSRSIIDKYDIGFLGEDQKLYKKMEDFGFDDETILSTGIFYNDKTCRYQNRVILPIKNEYGSVVSFTGRDITGESKQKYMHGTNTPVFKKSSLVWNLSKVRKAISEQDRVVVCEGQMDAISVTESGIPAVAILGSKISEQQLTLLSKICNNIYMMFDSDKSGEEGLVYAFKLMSDLELESVFYSVVLPSGKDPDEFIKQNGFEKFKDIIEAAKPDTSHIIQLLVKKNISKGTPNKILTIRKVLADLSGYIKKSYTYRSLDMIERLSQELGLSKKDLQSWIDSGTKFPNSKTTEKKIEEIHFPAPVYERRILYALLKDSSLMFKFRESGLSYMDFESPFVSKIVEVIKPGLSTNDIVDILRVTLNEKEYDMVISFVAQGLLETDFDTALDVLKAKVTFRSSKSSMDFLGRPLKSKEIEFRRVVGDVIRYGKEPF